MGTIVISLKNNIYRFGYHNKKGILIAWSTKFEEKKACFQQINFLKNNWQKLNAEDEKTSAGNLYFTIHLNNQMMLKSKKFNTPLLFEKAKSDLIANFTQTEVLDFTENVIFNSSI